MEFQFIKKLIDRPGEETITIHSIYIYKMNFDFCLEHCKRVARKSGNGFLSGGFLINKRIIKRWHRWKGVTDEKPGGGDF